MGSSHVLCCAQNSAQQAARTPRWTLDGGRNLFPHVFGFFFFCFFPQGLGHTALGSLLQDSGDERGLGFCERGAWVDMGMWETEGLRTLYR